MDGYQKNKVEGRTEMELSKSDLNFVLSRCPKDIVKLLKENTGTVFLAGGFIRATIAGEKVSDIDLLGDNADHLLSLAKDLSLSRKGRYFQTKNAITILAPPRIPVQLVTRWLFNDPQKLIESFDFTVCQSVVWATKVLNIDPPVYKFHSLISDQFYADLAARRLVYTFPSRDEDAGGSMMRVLKFLKKGYNIQAGSLAGVIARLAAKLDFKREPEEKWIAQVLTGLLREVDPLTVVDGVDFVDEHEVISNE
jgi:hypothetical protein